MRDQNQARGGSVAQLIDQQLLRGSGIGGQECRQIRDVAGARHDDGRQRDAARARAPSTARAPPVHGVAGGAQGHQRAIAVGLANFHPAAIDLATPSIRTCLTVCANLTVQRNQSQGPARHAAGKFHVKHPLERASIARQGGADALDERLNLRVALQIQHAACVRRAPRSIRRRRAPGLRRAASSVRFSKSIRRVVAQFARGFDRVLENGQELLLDELDPPVLAHRQQAHHLVEIARVRGRAARADMLPRQQRMPSSSNARARAASCSRGSRRRAPEVEEIEPVVGIAAAVLIEHARRSARSRRAPRRCAAPAGVAEKSATRSNTT